MGLVEIIIESNGDVEKVAQYTQDRTPQELYRQIRRSKQRDEAAKVIVREGIEFAIFQHVSEITGCEEIRWGRKTRLPHIEYASVFAQLLGSAAKESPDVKQFFLNLARKNELPEINEEHQMYLDAFTIEYVESKTTRQLRKELNRGNASLDPTVLAYSPFWHALSKKFQEDSELAYITMKKWTEWEAQEEIKARGVGGKKGAQASVQLATLFKGKRITLTETTAFFKDLAQAHGMPLLTEEHQQYVDNFTIEYVKSRTREQLMEELPPKNASTNPAFPKKYSEFLDVLSQKVRRDKELSLALMKQYTGWEAQEDIKQCPHDGKQGYENQARLATILRGSSHSDQENKPFFKKLAREGGMPLITKEHQAYVDSLTIESVRAKDRDTLVKELGWRHVYVSTHANRLDLFHDALAKKISADRLLAYEILCKMTGWKSLNDIKPQKHGEKQGYLRVGGLFSLLSGKYFTQVGKRDFARELFIEGTLRSQEFQEYLSKHGIKLDDLTTIPESEVHYVKSMLGGDFVPLAFRPRKRNKNPTARKRITEWSEIDTKYILDIADRFDSEKDIIRYMKKHKEQIQEKLGRSLYAAFKKLEYEGRLTEMERTGTRTNEIVYPFPPIHELYERDVDVSALFANQAMLLGNDLLPEIVSVLAYYDPAHTEDGQPQFVHASIPIAYQGTQFHMYAEGEELILGTVQRYLSDPGSFTQQGNKLVGEPAEQAHILQIRDGARTYTQLLQRTRFTDQVEDIETASLALPNGTEIYFFMHNKDDVSFATTLPKEIR